MEKIIFFALVIPIIGFVLYLGATAIMNGFSAKEANRSEKDEDIPNNDLISMIEIINDTLINYQKVNDKRIHLELCLMKLASLDSIKKKSL